MAASDGCVHRSPQHGDSRGLYGNSIVIKGSDTMVLLAQWWAENYLQSHRHLIIQVNVYEQIVYMKEATVIKHQRLSS